MDEPLAQAFKPARRIFHRLANSATLFTIPPVTSPDRQRAGRSVRA